MGFNGLLNKVLEDGIYKNCWINYLFISTNAFIKFFLICFLKNIIKIMCGRYIQLINSICKLKKFDIKSLFNEIIFSHIISLLLKIL